MKYLNMQAVVAVLVLVSTITKVYGAPQNIPAMSDQTVPTSGLDIQCLDKSVRPQADFYRYVNGGCLEKIEIPGDRSSWGSYDMLEEMVNLRMQKIIHSLAKQPQRNSSGGQKISDLYASFVDTSTIETIGLKPLASTFARIDAITEKSQLPTLMAQLELIGVTTPVEFDVHQDNKDSSHYAIDLRQSGLGLPDRNYYLKNDDVQIKAIQKAYQLHIEKMLSMAGETNASDAASAIMETETALARVQWDSVDRRNVLKRYNKVTLDKLNALTPAYDLLDFLRALGIADRINYVILSEPSYFTGLSKLVEETPLATWKSYLKWQTLNSYAPFLSARFVDENFAFNDTTLNGIPQPEPRSKRGIDLVTSTLGEALGKIYVAEYFSPKSQEKADQLVQNILITYKQSINSLDWMSPATKEEAQKKLAAIVPKVGFPTKWRDYSSLVLGRHDLVGNVMRANDFNNRYYLDKLGQPVDRSLWDMSPMTPQTVDSYYNPGTNDFILTAAILQPPFFHPTADDAVNYGAIGALIGHEISHAFDDRSSNYDEKGNLRNWWTDEDHIRFNEKKSALIKEYSAISPTAGYFVNGEQTVSENIADNAGLSVACRAYETSLHGKASPVIDGFTGEQRFYMAYARMWQNKTREKALIEWMETNVHSPAQVRGYITVQNQAGFYDAFDVKQGDPMFLAPSSRVSIW